MDKLPDETVLLAEICWDEPGTNANTVGTILRCLPAKAVERQKEHKLKALVFDSLMIDGSDGCDLPYEVRFTAASGLLMATVFPSDVMYMTQQCHLDEHHENFLEWADEIIADGGEGLVIQRKDNPYMPGTRTAWKTLKLKQSLPEMELKVIGTLEPNRKYEGDCLDTWKYWEELDVCGKRTIYDKCAWPHDHQVECVPVTKPYAMGWKNGVTVEYNNTTCDVTSGLTDADREWLATDEAQEMIKNGELYAVVKAMQTNDLGRLRHPYVVRLRNDL
jgi:ATP-dependent DNA ligase